MQVLAKNGKSLAFSYSVGEKVNWNSQFGKKLVSTKSDLMNTIYSAIPFLGKYTTDTCS